MRYENYVIKIKYFISVLVCSEMKYSCNYYLLQPKPYEYDYSEMLLYQNMILVEAEKYDEALKHLEQYEKQIVDKLAIQEIRGKRAVVGYSFVAPRCIII